jgi:hypothetical protein
MQMFRRHQLETVKESFHQFLQNMQNQKSNGEESKFERGRLIQWRERKCKQTT